MTPVAPVATLRVANVTRIFTLADGVVAALSQKAASIVRKGQKSKWAEIVYPAPRGADTFIPWLPPGASNNAVYVVYSSFDGSSSHISARLYDAKAEQAVEIAHGIPGRVVELSICFLSVLVARTSTALHVFFLESVVSSSVSSVAFTTDAVKSSRMGVCELPSWVCKTAEKEEAHVLLSTSEGSAVADREICIACIFPGYGRIYAAVLAVSTSSCSLAVTRQTAKEGLRLPAKASPSKTPLVVLGSAVRWSSQELVLLLQQQTDASSSEQPTVTSFCLSLQGATVGSLSSWRKQSAAALSRYLTNEAVQVRSVCVSDGAATVWIVDGGSRPALLLRGLTWEENADVVEVAQAVELPGNDTNAAILVASRNKSVCVLVGRSFYEIEPSSNDGAAPHKMKDSAAGQSSTPKATTGAAVEKCPLKQSQAAAITTSSLTSSDVKKSILKYLFEAPPDMSYNGPVIRDISYVQEVSKGGNLVFQHTVLDELAMKLKKNSSAFVLALLRYASVAQSFHPYTVLRLFHVKDDPGFILAMAVLLADKPTLQRGAVTRLPQFAASRMFYFSSASPLKTVLEMKEYTAAVTKAATTALMSGSLRAACLLYAVADAAVSELYGPERQKQVLQSVQPEEQRCDSSIAESISLIYSYANWTQTAATSIGTISAHVGETRTSIKEAALRDGRSQPINTSRRAEIQPLQLSTVPRQPRK